MSSVVPPGLAAKPPTHSNSFSAIGGSDNVELTFQATRRITIDLRGSRGNFSVFPQGRGRSLCPGLPGSFQPRTFLCLSLCYSV